MFFLRQKSKKNKPKTPIQFMKKRELCQTWKLSD